MRHWKLDFSPCFLDKLQLQQLQHACNLQASSLTDPAWLDQPENGRCSEGWWASPCIMWHVTWWLWDFDFSSFNFINTFHTHSCNHLQHKTPTRHSYIRSWVTHQWYSMYVALLHWVSSWDNGDSVLDEANLSRFRKTFLELLITLRMSDWKQASLRCFNQLAQHCTPNAGSTCF